RSLQPHPGRGTGWSRELAADVKEMTGHTQSCPGVPVPAQQEGVPVPAQCSGVPAPAQQPGVPVPAQRPGVPVPAQRPGVPVPAQQPGVPVPAQQPGVPVPAQCPGVPVLLSQPSDSFLPCLPQPAEAHHIRACLLLEEGPWRRLHTFRRVKHPH
uniref:Uncharacterized protein n=1 Tax=Serinus canaria TaxID=9135 RepID=A0A8C9NRJ1_SERCA